MELSNTGHPRQPSQPALKLSKTSEILWASVIMMVAAFAAFYVTAPGGFLSDDFGIIEDVSRQSFLQIFQPPATIAGDSSQFYRPLPLFLFWKLNLSHFGLNPAGYWAVSLVNHALIGLLLFLIVKRLSGSTLAALAGGLVFVLMPLQGESVAWLCCAYDRICLLFILSGILAYMLYLAEGKSVVYILSVVSFILALLSKENALSFPLLVILIEALSKEKGWKLKSAAARALPFFVLLGLYVLFRIIIFHGIGGYKNAQGQPVHQLFDLPQLYFALKSLPDFLLFPANRVLFRDMTFVYAGFGVLYLLIIVAQKWWGWVSLRLSFFGLAWVLLTVPVVLGMLPIGPNLECSRVLYTPLAGFAIFISGFFLPVAKDRRYAVLVKASILAALLAGYIYLDNVNHKAWKVAYNIDRSILSQTMNLYPSLPAGAGLYYVSLPDNYAGAYLFRNGLESAVNLSYGYEGTRRVHASICNVDGTLLSDPSRNYEAIIAGGGNNYVFWYSWDSGALVKVFPR